MNKNIQIIPTDPDRDNINDNFNATNGCLIHSHTIFLQNKIAIIQHNIIVITPHNKIAIALQNKIVIVLHGEMQVIDNRI